MRAELASSVVRRQLVTEVSKNPRRDFTSLTE